MSIPELSTPLPLSNNVLKLYFLSLLKAEVSDILVRDNYLICLSIFLQFLRSVGSRLWTKKGLRSWLGKGGGPYPVKVSLLPNHSHKARWWTGRVVSFKRVWKQPLFLFPSWAVILTSCLGPKTASKCKGFEEEYLLTDAETCLWWQWITAFFPSNDDLWACIPAPAAGGDTC